ncbi:S41 family peptidase [bacterium]|nr:MAG: S41 family peptidase [bacterium]
MKTLKHFVKSYFIFMIALVTFATGFWLGKSEVIDAFGSVSTVINQEVGKPDGVDFSLFWDTWKTVENKFAGKESMNVQDMVYGATAGMVDALDDPYTTFMNPHETEKFTTDISGSFEGIGAEIGVRDSFPVIIAPLSGMPAEQAGMMSGDRILKVDDTVVIDLPLDEIVDLIRGPKNTEVTLTVIHKDADNSTEISITRGTIDVPSMRWEMVEDNIALIHFYQFSADADREFKKAISEAMQQGMTGLILDMRNNPGGYLEVATEISSQFIDKGEVVLIEEYADGERKEHKSSGGNILKDYPSVILVNEGSASASEIVAGALRDHNNILLIGQKTYGKGSVQELENLKGGSSLKVTVAKWLTPSGVCINKEGLEPDIEVELTFEQFEAGEDPQLSTAEKTIKELIQEDLR